ncbi:MAG TPA: hypothetical protein EYP24_04095, partial [bacterium (Candidatus Stahlbacteria)]|nr:hypothetical protein [Candidatus Stahlbacteria bacterium]
MLDTIIFDFWITLVKIDRFDIQIRQEMFWSYLKGKTNLSREDFERAYDRAVSISERLRSFNREVPADEFVFYFR